MTNIWDTGEHYSSGWTGRAAYLWMMAFKITHFWQIPFRAQWNENKTQYSFTWSSYRVWFTMTTQTLKQNRFPTDNQCSSTAHLLPLYNIKLHSLSIPNTAKIFPWVVFLNGRLDTRAAAVRTHPKTKRADRMSLWCQIIITTWWTKTSSFVSFLKNKQKHYKCMFGACGCKSALAL